jgi:hypothetical protein
MVGTGFRTAQSDGFSEQKKLIEIALLTSRRRPEVR